MSSSPEAVLIWVDQHDSAEISKSTQVIAEKGVQVVRCRFTQDLQEFLENRQHLRQSSKLRIITNRVRTTETGDESAEGLVQWLRTNGWLCPVLVYCGKPELCRNLELKYTNVLVSKSKTISRTFGCMEPCSFRRTGPVSTAPGAHQKPPAKADKSEPKAQKTENKVEHKVEQKVEQKPPQKPEPKAENKTEAQKKVPVNGRASEKKGHSETDTSPSPSPPASEDGFTSEDEDFPLLSMNEIDQIISEFDDMEGALEEKKGQDSSSDSDLYFSDDD